MVIIEFFHKFDDLGPFSLPTETPFVENFFDEGELRNLKNVCFFVHFVEVNSLAEFLLVNVSAVVLV